MHHPRFAILVFTSIVGSLLGCSSDPEGARSASSPLTTCSGAYVCTSPDAKSMEASLHRHADGRCTLDDIELTEDGRIRAEGLDGTWSGDAARIALCAAPDVCVTCDAVAPPGGHGEKKCVGSPRSCSSERPGSCASIRGCRMRTRVKYDGSYDNWCDGSPDACDTIGSETACLRQGCNWQ